MSDKITPREPEHISCKICMKEIPIDTAKSVEAVDYVVHFCGMGCYEKWKDQQHPLEQDSD